MFRARYHWAIASLITLGFLVMSQGGCSHPSPVAPSDPPAAPNAPSPALVAQGKVLWTTCGASGKGCAGCHGADGHGYIGPNIIGKNLSDIQAAFGNPIMSGEFAGSYALTASQSEAVAAYLSTLN